MSTPNDSTTGDEPCQSTRQHIFAVNHDLEFLDIVRVLLQDEHYNVTTTNYVPAPGTRLRRCSPLCC